MKGQAWKDIWGSGQGIGAIKKSKSTIAELVGQLKAQFGDACQALNASRRHAGLSRGPDSAGIIAAERFNRKVCIKPCAIGPFPGRADMSLRALVVGVRECVRGCSISA